MMQRGAGFRDSGCIFCSLVGDLLAPIRHGLSPCRGKSRTTSDHLGIVIKISVHLNLSENTSTRIQRCHCGNIFWEVLIHEDVNRLLQTSLCLAPNPCECSNPKITIKNRRLSLFQQNGMSFNTSLTKNGNKYIKKYFRCEPVYWKVCGIIILEILSYLRHLVHWKAYAITFWQMWKGILGFELRSTRIVWINLIPSIKKVYSYIQINRVSLSNVHKWFHIDPTEHLKQFFLS